MKTSARPVIGINLDYVENSVEHSYSLFPWYALRTNYPDCVLAGGGLPIMIPYQYETLDQIIELIDGLLIPGASTDILPELYGQEILSDKVKINKIRTEFEAALMQKALDKDIPIFGICNGMQLLNVLHGGTLIQHIPDIINNSGIEINHEQPPPKDIPTHKINILPGTILHSLAGVEELSVNSTHHQAIDRIGESFVISAQAPDGIIEAIEMKNRKFVVGVEWHPEYNGTQPLDEKLFQKFIESCKK